MSLFQRKLITEDENEDAGTFQQQALEINLPGKNFDPNAVPTNGEEFLTFMAYERKNTPVVVTRSPAVKKLKKDTANEIAPPYTASILNDQKCAAHGRDFVEQSNTNRCTAAWKEWQLQHFQTTRAQAHALRNQNFNTVSMQQTQAPPADANDWLQLCSNTMPLLKETLTLGQRDLENLLEAICDWLQRGDEAAAQAQVANANANESVTTDDPTDDNNTVNDNSSTLDAVAAENLRVTTPWLGQWLYATLVCLNLPLEPFVHSAMREIVRIFVRQRALLSTSDQDAVQHINTYNIFIHIIAKFFGQLDFAEFV